LPAVRPHRRGGQDGQASGQEQTAEAELTGHARSFAAALGLRESLTEELQLVGE
jgi:hypothetical protein